MNNKELPCDELHQFLEDVTDQIQYKPIRGEIEEELKAHIEDRTLEYVDMGMAENEAAHKAVEQMGNATSIGIMMNDAKHVRTHWPLLILVLICVFLGALRNFMDYPVTGEFALDHILFNMNYFLFGLIVLAVIYYRGYLFVVKHTNWLLAGFLALFLIQKAGYAAALTRYHYSSHVVLYSMLLLFGPLLAITAYLVKSKGRLTIILYFVILSSILLLMPLAIPSYFLTAVSALIITGSAAMFFLIQKGYLPGNKKISALFCCAGVVVTILIFIMVSDQKENIELFLHPEQQAEEHFQDGYNGILIKDLLSKAELFGSISLTQDELYNYGTGTWHFDAEEVAKITKYLHYDKSNITLNNILPQHFHNNYRFAYWILVYGWIPGILLITFVIGLYVLLFCVTHKIKNKLGQTLSFSCSVCLTVQMLFYLLGNLGYQYGFFSTLPFISEGLCSITINMILVGLILSAYRFDTVVNEDTYKKKTIKIKIAY